MSFGIPVRNGLGLGLRASTTLSTRGGVALPSLSLDFLTMSALPASITFSRGSNATLTDSTGKLTYAPNNLITYSEQFNNVAWGLNAASATPNVTTAPDGTLTADKLVENASTATHGLDAPTSTVAAGVKYIGSVYAKAAERRYLFLALAYGAFVSGNGVCFDLQTGTIVGSGTGSASAGTITSVGNGWYRCSIALTATVSTSLIGVPAIYLSDAPTNSLKTYTGDGTSGIYVWGAQNEAATYQTAPSTYNAVVASPYYGPRFDYDPVTLAAKGLLIEEQRSNLALYSEQFDNAAWTGFSTTITANATTAPSGVTTADKLVESAGAAFHAFYTTASPTGSVTGNYTFSVYAKVGERRYISMDMGDYANGTVFDLQTGTVTGTNTTYTAAITPAGNGWYRCSVSRNFTVATSLFPQILLSTSATVPNSYTGDGTSGVFIWGAQMEAGAFATSYIPTVASSVTRSADAASMTGTNFSSWFNASEGTFISGVQKLSPAATATFAYEALGASSSFSMRVRLGTDARMQSVDGGVAQVDAQLAASVPTTASKYAMAYKLNDYAGSANGAAVVTDTTATVPALSSLSLGSASVTNIYIRTLSYYNSRLSNTQLQALTA